MPRSCWNDGPAGRGVGDPGGLEARDSESPRTAAYRIWRRLREHRDRLLYPEAASGSEQWQRVTLNQAVNAHIAALDPPRLRAAEISGDNHAGKPWKEHSNLAYPEFDLCAPLQEERRFDVVICEQVLEHVVDPWAAAANLRRLCAEGGHVIVSTPFLVKVHELPAYACATTGASRREGLRTAAGGSGPGGGRGGGVGQPPVRGRKPQPLVGLPPLAFAPKRARPPGPGLGLRPQAG